MKRRFKTSLIAIALAVVASGSFYAGAQAATARAERHPAIRAAIDALEKARYDLKHAAHDFGGHRVDALAATDAAITQLKLALQYDH